MSLDKRTVIVTGAAGSLGKAVARAFDDLGTNLVLVDLERIDWSKPSARRPTGACSSLRICWKPQALRA